MTKLKRNKILIKESRTKINEIKRKMIKAQISKTKFNLHFFLWEEREKKRKKIYRRQTTQLLMTHTAQDERRRGGTSNYMTVGQLEPPGDVTCVTRSAWKLYASSFLKFIIILLWLTMTMPLKKERKIKSTSKYINNPSLKALILLT